MMHLQQELRDFSWLLLLWAVQDHQAETATVKTAAEALWLGMEQCLDCRADFEKAHGIKALLNVLESGMFARESIRLGVSSSVFLHLGMVLQARGDGVLVSTRVV